jgi:hypothetical protein
MPMARLSSLAHPLETLALSSDPLADDKIGFDAWLLPPEIPGPVEQAIRLCSIAAGPVAFAVALACVINWIV